MDTLQNIDYYRLIDIALLHDAEREMHNLEKNVALNGFQKWILRELYRFDTPDAPFTIRSILLMAIPHPVYAAVTFAHDGREYSCVSLVRSDFESAGKALQRNAETLGFMYQDAGNLPLKYIGVRSGLAEYGKNNVTYIDGLGSCFSYAAYFTDLEPTMTGTREVTIARICEHCKLCQNACPTGAIRSDSFIIDNERCLSCLNESGEPFPEWVPISAHHSLYDCLYCQLVCPMNRDRVSDVGRNIAFNEDETKKLLQQEPFESYDENLKAKSVYLGLNQWPAGISKNMKKIMEKADMHPLARSIQ